MTRVLIAARLSRNAGADQASRIERDDEEARKWAQANGRDVVDTSEDRNVSGKTDPFKRPALGPWLTKPELIERYDEIVASSIDRLARNAWELFRLREWARENAKKLTILSPPLTWPPAPDDFASPIMWDLLGRLAEIERQMIAKRIADSQSTIRENHALTGRPPFGFEVVGDTYHKTLAPDPRLVPYLREMVARARKDEPLHRIARWLDDEGVIPVQLRAKVPDGVRQEVLGPPLFNKWSTVTVSKVLRSPALKGRRLDANGKVLVRHEGIMRAGEWDALQASLDARPARRGPTINTTAMLTGSIVCDLCGSPMYRKHCPTTHKNGTIHVNTYYRCDGNNQQRSRCKNMVPLGAVDDYVNAWFTADGPYAHTEIIERIGVPGDDHKAEIADVEAQYRELSFDDPELQRKQTRLLEERNRLLSLPQEPSTVEERPTGKTVGDIWLSLDDAGRRSYLTRAGVTVRVRPVPEGTSSFHKGNHAVWVEGNPYQLIGTLRSLSSGEHATG